MIRVNFDKKIKYLPNKLVIKNWVKHCLNFFEINAEIHIDFVDSVVMQDLNNQYRAKNYATNVLSFTELVPLPRGKVFLGNIILCPEILMEEAIVQQKKFLDHLVHIIFHGCLHLLGFDHEKNIDAQKMEAMEIMLLNQLGINNPYESC